MDSKCWFCGEIISVNAVVCPSCGRQRQQSRKKFRAWKIFFGDAYAGLSLLYLVTSTGVLLLALVNHDNWTVSFSLVVILATVLPATWVIRWRIKRYQRIFREGIYLKAIVVGNDISTRKWDKTYYDHSIANQLSYLDSVRSIGQEQINVEDARFNILRYRYSYKGQEYHQRLPYTPGKAMPKVVRDRIFRLLRAKPPTHITLWILSLKPGDTIDIVLSPDNPKQAYVVNLYTEPE